MSKRLNFEEKLAAVTILTGATRPLQGIAHRRDSLAEEVPQHNYDSESIRARSRARSKAIIERQRTQR